MIGDLYISKYNRFCLNGIDMILVISKSWFSSAAKDSLNAQAQDQELTKRVALFLCTHLTSKMSYWLLPRTCVDMLESSLRQRGCAPKSLMQYHMRLCICDRRQSIGLAGWQPSWLAGSLARWLAGELAGWLDGWLAGWLARWLAGWLAGELARWLAGRPDQLIRTLRIAQTAPPNFEQ